MGLSEQTGLVHDAPALAARSFGNACRLYACLSILSKQEHLQGSQFHYECSCRFCGRAPIRIYAYVCRILLDSLVLLPHLLSNGRGITEINSENCRLPVPALWQAFAVSVFLSKEEMNREPFETFFNQIDDSDKSLAYFKQALQGEPQRGEINLLHKDGHRLLLDMIAIPEYKEDKVIGICIICKNMTERKNATEILLDGTWDGYGIFDEPGNFSLFIVELISMDER